MADGYVMAKMKCDSPKTRKSRSDPGLLPPRTGGEIREQREVEGLRTIKLHVINTRAAKLAVVTERQTGELAQVRSAHGLGIRGHFVRAFQVFETRRPSKRERQLVRIQYLEHHHVRAAEFQMAQSFDDRGRIVEQIGNEHHEAALEQRLGKLVEGTAD